MYVRSGVRHDTARPPARRAALTAAISAAVIASFATAGVLAPQALAVPGAIERVSAGPTGGNGGYPPLLAGGNRNDGLPSGVSDDGLRVYFTTTEQLTSDDTDVASDLYERFGAVTTLVSDDVSATADANTDVTYAGVSKDGTSVFFTTTEELAPDSGPTDGDATTDVYVRDGGVLRLVSTANGSGNSAFGAAYAGTSQNGEYAVFSTAEPLTADDTDASSDVYGRTLDSGTTERLSEGADDTSGNGPFSAAFSGISDDGSRVFFSTTEQVLTEDNDGSQDIYERRPLAPTTVRVSQGNLAGSGNGAFAASYAGASTDGTVVFFHTAEQLDSDTDTAQDVYSRTGGATTNVSAGSANTPATLGGASEDGAVAVYLTAEPQLPADDDAASVDVYRQPSAGALALVSDNGDDCVGCDAAINAGLRNAGSVGDSTDLLFAVSADGSRIFYTTTEFSGGSILNVYRYILGGAPAALMSTDSVPGCNSGLCDRFFAGASADGNSVAIASFDALTAEDTDCCSPLVGGGALDVYVRTVNPAGPGAITILATAGPANDSVPDHGPYDGDNCCWVQSRDLKRFYFQTPEPLVADDADAQNDIYFGAVEAISQTVTAGGTVSTGAAPTPTDPVETSVTSPNPGGVTIQEFAPSVAPPPGYTFLGYQSRITAPTAPGAGNPLIFKFRLDSSLLPAGYDEMASGCGSSPSQCVQVFRNGVQAGTCLTPGNASPSPCVDGRTQTGGAGNDIEITVLAVSASDWNFGLPQGSIVIVKDAIPDDAQDFGFTAGGGLAPSSFSLDDDSDGDAVEHTDLRQRHPWCGLLGCGERARRLGPVLGDLRRRQPGDQYRRGCRRDRHLHLHQPQARSDRGRQGRHPRRPAGLRLHRRRRHQPGELLARRRRGRDAFEHAHAGRRGRVAATRCPRRSRAAGTRPPRHATTALRRRTSTSSAGETVTCTFANRKLRSIVAVKDATPQRPAGLQLHGGRRPFSGELPARRRLRRDALQHAHVRRRRRPAPATRWRRRCPRGGTQTGASCSDGSSVSSIDLAAGETVTCTFTNRKLGQITVVKDAIPNGAQDFPFTAGGGLTPRASTSTTTPIPRCPTREPSPASHPPRVTRCPRPSRPAGSSRAPLARTAARSRTSTWLWARASPAPS